MATKKKHLIGFNANEELATVLKARIDALGVTMSDYLKGLVKRDLEGPTEVVPTPTPSVVTEVVNEPVVLPASKPLAVVEQEPVASTPSAALVEVPREQTPPPTPKRGFRFPTPEQVDAWIDRVAAAIWKFLTRRK